MTVTANGASPCQVASALLGAGPAGSARARVGCRGRWALVRAGPLARFCEGLSPEEADSLQTPSGNDQVFYPNVTNKHRWSPETTPEDLKTYTRLLDILAARKDPQGLSGDVLKNGAPRPANFKCNSGYVVQVIITVFLGLVIGAIFYDLKSDPTGIQNRCTGEEFLRSQGIDLSPWGLWKNLVALACMIVIFLTIAYLKLLFLKKFS